MNNKKETNKKYMITRMANSKFYAIIIYTS